MISYSNTPLGGTTDPDGRLERKLTEWWHRHGIREWDHPGYYVSGIDHLPIPPAPKRECPRPGVLVWPAGAGRWAEFHCYVTGDQLAAIGSPTSSRTFILTDGTTAVQTPLWMLAPRLIGQVAGADYFLLTLVDDRYWWWQKAAAAPTSPTSWSDLLTSLLSSVGVSATIPSIPGAYGTPDVTRWNVGYKPLPLLIDAACATVGLRLTRTLAGAVVISTATAATNAEDDQWTKYQPECLTGGRVDVAQVGAAVPATVRVVFPGDSPDTVDQSLAGAGLTQYAGATGMPGMVATVAADPGAGYSGETSYALQAARDYYLWALSRVDATFRGVQLWPPTGLEDRIEWDHSGGKILTRVFRSAVADQNVYGDRKKDTVLVRCTSATPADGTTLGSQCYPATVTKISSTATSFPDSTAVWLTILQGSAGSTAPTAPTVNQEYAATLAGTVTVGGSTRPRAFAVGTSAGSFGCPGGDEWTAGLLATDCLQVTAFGATGRCAPWSPAGVTLVYNSGADAWVSTSDMTLPSGATASLKFSIASSSGPHLDLTLTGGSGGPTYRMVRSCSGGGAAVFAGPTIESGSDLCNGPLGLACAGGIFYLKVACGGNSCTGASSACCGGNTMPPSLCLSFSGYARLAGVSVQLSYFTPGTGTPGWKGTFTDNDGNGYLAQLICGGVAGLVNLNLSIHGPVDPAPVYAFSWQEDGGDGSTTTSYACPNMQIVGTMVGTASGYPNVSTDFSLFTNFSGCGGSGPPSGANGPCVELDSTSVLVLTVPAGNAAVGTYNMTWTGANPGTGITPNQWRCVLTGGGFSQAFYFQYEPSTAGGTDAQYRFGASVPGATTGTLAGCGPLAWSCPTPSFSPILSGVGTLAITGP